MGHGVATALEFYNGDNLLFPSFQYDPQSNLSSIIGFSLDNNSKVELSRDAQPVRIRFKQVIVFTKLQSKDFVFPAVLPSWCQLSVLAPGRSSVVWRRLPSERWSKQPRGDGLRLLPPHQLQPLHGLDWEVFWVAFFTSTWRSDKGTIHSWTSEVNPLV